MFGFAIFLLVYLVGPISGGHINPAITIAFVLTGKTSIVRGIMYIIAQVRAGAVVERGSSGGGALVMRRIDLMMSSSPAVAAALLRCADRRCTHRKAIFCLLSHRRGSYSAELSRTPPASSPPPAPPPQCAGAIAGTALAGVIHWDTYMDAGGAANGSDFYSAGSQMCFEIVATALLVFTALSTADPYRAKSGAQRNRYPSVQSPGRRQARAEQGP